MAVVPFRWLGRQRAEALADLLNQRLCAWLTEWASTDRTSTLALVQDVSGADKAGGRWYSLELAPGRLSLWLADGAHARVGAWLAGASAAGDDGLAAGVGVRALNDAARALTGLARGELVATTALSTEALAARRGGMLLGWRLAGLDLRLHLDAGACSTLLPSERRSSVPLVPFKDAIGRTDVSLSVLLSLGSARLSDVSELKPGMVLRTRTPVTSHLKLVAPDGKVIGAGPLTAYDGRRAIRIK